MIVCIIHCGLNYHPNRVKIFLSRNEIRSGTAVTYNDRQEILCQSCTHTTLRDRDLDDNDHSEQTTPTNERADRPAANSTSENGGDTLDGLLDFSKIQDISPAVRARLGSTLHVFECVYIVFLRQLVIFLPLKGVLAVLFLIECAGCNESIHSCQSLIALDKHWHLFCFNCRKCNKLLTSDYMNRCVCCDMYDMSM